MGTAESRRSAAAASSSAVRLSAAQAPAPVPRRGGLLLLGAATLVVVSCAAGGRGRNEFAVERVYGQGAAVELTVRVSKARITTAEDLVLLLETRAAEQWNVAFPEVPDTLGKFTVARRGQETRRLDRSRNLISTRRYTLEPFLPGDYAIPPLEVRFGEGGGSYPFSLSSEEIPIVVTTVLPPQLGRQDIEDIADPRSLPSKRPLWYGAGALVLAAAGTAGGLLLRRHLRSAGRAARPRDPGLVAREELDALLADRLVEQGRVREFYVALSGLARSYVEGRFGIRAPELTTEEFLQQAERSEALAEHREALREFLAHCDLVKFARYRPAEAEVEATILACRSFLTQTSPGGRL